jgi:CubicO group peptidase (beta-lactamase class C family)
MRISSPSAVATLGAAIGLAIVGWPLSAPAQSLPPKAAVARVADSLAKDFIASGGAPGVSIAVVRGRDTLLFGGWGKADLENDIAATARTVYRIGSITKQFTSSAVMQFVEQGKVRLEDSIGTYLPTLPAAWRGVTVHQLLNHTSGVPSYTDIGPRWVRRWGEEMTPDTLVALTASDTLWFKPGSKWRYDNSGYVVLGMLIEKIAGHSWAADIEERFAKPLGLADTRYCATKPLIARRARGYDPLGKEWQNATYLAMSQPFSAGALCSSVGDLARWNRALASGQVVSAASYQSMTTPDGAAATAHYGFGLSRDTLANHTFIAHGGGIHGFISSNGWVPDAQLSVTVLSNSGAARTDRLMAQLVRASLGVPLLQPPKLVTLSAAERAPYVGVYSLQLPAGARDFTVTERDGTLYGQLAGQGANALLPYGNHTFGAAFDPDVRVIFTVENGRATKMVLLQGGARRDGIRK